MTLMYRRKSEQVEAFRVANETLTRNFARCLEWVESRGGSMRIIREGDATFGLLDPDPGEGELPWPLNDGDVAIRHGDNTWTVMNGDFFDNTWEEVR